jgi:putative transposase
METYETLKHTTWECKYHIVFIPKCRKKVLYGEIRRELGAVFKDLTRQRESEIHEGHLMPDHVHMLISIPPKYSVAQVMGFMKGKKGDPHCSGVGREKEELRGAAVLGTGLLGVDGGPGRRGGAPIHPRAREGRSAHGPTWADAALSG